MMKKTLLLLSMLIALASVTSCFFQAQGTVVRSETYDDAGLLVIPGTYVYYYNDNQNDMYYYSGNWWRLSQSGWQRSDIYSGPWVAIEMDTVPQPVTHLPDRWKENIRRDDKINYTDVHSHWREWENDKYWEKRNWRKDQDKAKEDNRRMNDNINNRQDNKSVTR